MSGPPTVAVAPGQVSQGRSTAEHELIDLSLAGLRQAAPGTDPDAIAELDAAFRAGELQVWYQPIVDLATGQITSAEALIRWQHPRLGLLLPARFIPAAERGGLIIPIGHWVLQQACCDAARWPQDLPVAVNLQPDQLRDPRLIEDVRRALSAGGLPAARLTLEVTESVLVHDARAAAETLARLRDMGITIAIDDFGTGYSSPSYLQHLPVSILKIDRTFIASLPDSTPVSLAQTIVQLATTLGLKTVAEGIETDLQLQTCKDLGCQSGQGFLLAKPMPCTSLIRILTTRDMTRAGTARPT
jgi:EAL domain-containing protein (putative c-di-GMP-specific phosphodiesterase class I)